MLGINLARKVYNAHPHYITYEFAPRSPNGGKGGKHRTNRQHQRAAAKARNKR